jgi:hypothetical protein
MSPTYAFPITCLKIEEKMQKIETHKQANKNNSSKVVDSKNNTNPI